MKKHLVFGTIPLDPTESGIKVFTSDGKDLSEYFHIVSIDGLKAGVDSLTAVTLTVYASVGMVDI